jgi:hypothetical protein
MSRYTRWSVAIVAAALVCVTVGLRSQAGTAPILVVLNSASPNPYGGYLGEILQAEGLNSFATVQLSSVTPTTLASAQVVVLAETPLTAAQATLFGNYVAAGGRLVAMRPDAQLLPVLGLSSAGSTTNEGYFAVNAANVFSDGFPTATLPIHGSAQNDVPALGTQVLATLYSNASTATIYPAVVRFGTTVTWTYDLAQSVVYTRQGNPANASERDGSPPYRTEDVYYNAIDRDKVGIPYADVQMRMFARAITDLLAGAMPLPRLWYFPGTSKTLVVLTADSHANPQADFDAEISAVESYGGRLSLYVYNGGPSPASVTAWQANGHEVGMHPAAYMEGVNLATAFQNNLDWFLGTYEVAPSATTRNHQVEWQGWVDAAKIAATYGIGLDTTNYTWGPAITYPDGHQAHGYINGSGQPMRFIDEAGTIVPVYQQTTSLVDEALVWGEFSEHLASDDALAVSRQLIDSSQAGDYAAITTQFHVDYFAFGEVNPWETGTMAYAQSQGIPMWTARRWLDYTSARYATTLSGYSWSAGSQQLSFDVTVPLGSETQTIVLPGVFGGLGVTSITLDGAPVSGSSQVVSGRAATFIGVGPGTHSVAATYTTVVAPPEHSPLAANDSASVAEGHSVTIPVLANDVDPDGDPLTVTSVGADAGADITINADQTISYAPHALTCGQDSFSYTISDGRGGSASATVVVGITCLNGQMTQNASASLLASCTVPTNTIVTGVGDGEIRLAGLQGDEFSSPILNPDEWVAGTWSGGAYTPAIANGVMSLSSAAGAFVHSATSLPVTTLEARVTFSAQQWEYVGWATLDIAGGYATFSTFDSSTTLFAKTSADGLTEQQTNLGTIPSGFHTYRISRQAASSTTDTVSYYVDGSLVAQHSVATLPAMYVYQSNAGGTAHALAIDRIWAYPSYTGAGTYQSCTQDIGHSESIWTRATWSAVVPAGTSLQMRTRTSTSGTDWSGWSAPLTASGQDITSPAGRYLQYLLEFTTANPSVSAVVDSVTLSYADASIPVDHAPVATSDVASTTQGSPVTVSVLANDTDPDGDPLTVTAVTSGVKGSADINPDKTITYTPTGTACGTDSFTYTVGDGRGLTATTTVGINIVCLAGQTGQATVANFGPVCSTRADTIISQMGDGEIRLAGLHGDEYAGATLDGSLWTSGTWSGGGSYTPVLSGGILSIGDSDGGYVRSNTSLPVSTIEASVRFGALPWQHVGWGGLDLGSGGDYAFFSTYNTSTSLFARTYDGGPGGEQQTNLGAIPSGFHRYRVTRQVASPTQDVVRYYIDGALVATHTVATLPAMYVYQSNLGASPTLDVDWLWVYPDYRSSGTFQSCAVDGGTSSFDWTTAAWTGSIPAATSVQLSTRTSPDGASWSSWSTPLTTSGGGITSPAGRYLQYLLQFATSDPSQSPVVDSVAFGTTLTSVDSTPPVVSSIAVSSITSSSAVISWTTDEPSSSQVQFGPTRAYGQSTTADAALVTSHSQLLTGLWGGTLYDFRVVSIDGTGNEADSANVTFTTGAPSLSIADVSVTEPASGTATAVFTVTLSPPSSQTVTVLYATADGTARTGSNYSATSGTLTFAPVMATQTISVPILSDLAVTPNLTFTVSLSGASGADVSRSQATGTVINTDVWSYLSVNDVTITEPASGSVNANFTVTMSPAAKSTVTVNYGTANGTALAGTNYTTRSGVLTFAVGATSGTISVPILNDGLYRAQDLGFVVNLSDATATNAQISRAQGAGSIVNSNAATMNVTAPATGASWTIGTVQTITWTNNLGSPATVRLDLSQDGGSTWPTTIAASVQNSSATGGSYNWTVAGSAATSARIRAVWTTDTNVVGSTGNFTLAAPAMSVTAPATGASWTIGTVQTISWTNNLGPTATVRLDLSQDGGSTWPTTIAASVQNSSATGGSYNWTVAGSAGTTARIRAVWTSNPSVLGSTGNVTLANPTMSVTAPFTGASWTIGTAQTISWTNNLGPTATVRLDLSQDGGGTWATIAASVQNSSATGGSYNWTVEGSAVSTARIRAVWTGNPSVLGSTGDFTLANPAVSVTSLTASPPSPQLAGTSVTWTAGAAGGDTPLQYQYWLNTDGVWSMVRDFEASNTWTWTPTQIGQYTVRVRVRSAGSSSSHEALKDGGFYVRRIGHHDFDGDGKTDLTVWRPSEGMWYTRNSSTGYSLGGYTKKQWGLVGDVPLAGDFDDDGRTDLAVWRPSNGTWYIRTSSRGYSDTAYEMYQWGLVGDVPLAVDFDGDGRTDLAVWRPSDGTWYIRTSSTGYSDTAYEMYQWGLVGDIPLAVDFDGDGRTDLAVWRPSDGTWYIRTSLTGYSDTAYEMYQWGLAGDVPLAADFDGDGKTDLTVFRPSDGTWYVWWSSTNYSATAYATYQWGLVGDIPVVGDFDGDGEADPTVWRRSEGTWYILPSGTGYAVSGHSAYQWGAPEDSTVN